MVDIIIVNWNAGQQLASCIDSIRKYGNGLVSKVIVVDNGSTDGSDSAIDDGDDVLLLRAGENLGFGRACNLGARYADSKYLLFLNPDAELMLNTLDEVVSFMEQSRSSKIGICGVQLIDENNCVARSCSYSRTLHNMVAHSIGIDRVCPKLGPAMRTWAHNESRPVDQVIGAFYLVRQELFNALNGFDERYFVYYEEVDFALRARRAGWSSFFLASAQAFHLGGGTSSNVKANRLFYSIRSRLQFAFANFSYLEFLVIAALSLFVEPLFRSFQSIVKLSFGDFINVWRAYCLVAKWLVSKLGLVESI